MNRYFVRVIESVAFVALVAAFGAVLSVPTPANAQIKRSSAQASSAVATDVYKVAYFDINSQATNPFGGLEPVGGDGEELVRTINPTSTPILCQMVYVWDASEELQECCGCIVTNDGLRVEAVGADLTANPSNGAAFGYGTIDIISSLPNAPAPVECDPALALSLSPALRSSITHVESSGETVSVSVENFQDAPLDATNEAAMVADCAFIHTNQSGHGICSCGVGDNTPETASAKR